MTTEVEPSVLERLRAGVERLYAFTGMDRHDEWMGWGERDAAKALLAAVEYIEADRVNDSAICTHASGERAQEARERLDDALAKLLPPQSR